MLDETGDMGRWGLSLGEGGLLGERGARRGGEAGRQEAGSRGQRWQVRSGEADVEGSSRRETVRRAEWDNGMKSGRGAVYSVPENGNGKGKNR